MRLRYICFAILLGLSSFLIPEAKSQTISIDNLQSVKVSQLSDQQILTIWNRFQSSGMTESAAYELLQQRGMPLSEIEAFRKRIMTIQSSGMKADAPGMGGRSDSLRSKRDTITPILPDLFTKSSRIYGYDFFSNPRLTFEPDLRIATPANYILGPEDELSVMVTGLNETSFSKQISPDGNLQLPRAGIVYLNGLSVDAATRVIRNSLQKIYPAISSGQTRVTVNLGNVRSIRVTLMGEINVPGTYTVSSLSTVFNAIYLSGGPNENGSLRNIELIRGNRVVRTIDLYQFLQTGILDDNIGLRDQDVIRFPVYSKRVSIDGAVKRPAVYELKESENLETLIRYAGGFADNAYRGIAKVSQLGDRERSLRDVPSSLFDRYVPANADSVFFEVILDRYTNRVNINGAVYRPGTFELTEGLTLNSLIAKADGLRDDAFLSRGFIKRTTPDLEKEVVSFDLNRIRSGAQPDIVLMREDSVTILSTRDLVEGRNVTINGYVRNPGTYTFRQGMNIQDIVAMAGGFSDAAASHRVEISRILRDQTDIVANELVKTFTVELDSSLNSSEAEFPLQALDYVYVPRLVNYRSIGNVSIEGEVLFPGDYAIQKRDETANDIIARAGGLTPSGSLPQSQVFRNGIRVDVDLTNTTNSFNAKNMIVLPGDSIVIPRENLFVEVTGEVNTPQLLSYTRSGFKYYINAAGGVKQNAHLRRAYIQYPNGINRPVRKFLFFRVYPSVQPGSKIIVPVKPAELKFKLGIGEVSAITSVLTALVGLVAILTQK